MKKFLLLTAGLLMALAVNAQTYNNPRQSSNDSRAKVVKVERTANSTIVYLKFTTNNSKAQKGAGADAPAPFLYPAEKGPRQPSIL